MYELWNKVKPLFENDDGSLPDIFVENLTTDEINSIYKWILSISCIDGEPTVWSFKKQKDIAVSSLKNAAKAFNLGEIESFRHLLKEFDINGTLIPQLSVCIEKGEISFDYRKGKEWGPEQVKALFEFLSRIKDRAKKVRIIQADECSYEEPNILFNRIFDKYYSERITFDIQ